MTINKVEKAQHELTELIDKQRIAIIKQFESITREIRYRREEENFVDNDIDELKQKLEQFTQKDTTKTIIVTNNQID
ncbi:unnamed protein product [Rotaria sordida]|nr:unnamed protein product [Rotaria sordida]